MKRSRYKYQAAREAIELGKLTVLAEPGIILGPRGNAIGAENPDGYISFAFGWATHGRRIDALVHVVVWEFVNGEIEDESLQVNHKDGIKSNCSIHNLELLTASGNAIHALQNNLFSSRFTIEQVAQFRALAHEGFSAQQIADRFSVNVNAVRPVISGKRWAHVDAPTKTRKRVSDEVRAEVRRRVTNGEKQIQVARVLGLSTAMVSRVVNNLS